MTNKQVKNLRSFVTIVTVLVMLTGSLYIVVSLSPKIIVTGLRLTAISSNIQHYNEQSRKTDKMTEQAMEDFALRDQEFYNSSDPVVRTYSNWNALVKLLVWLLAGLSYPILLLMWAYHILGALAKHHYRKQKRKQ